MAGGQRLPGVSIMITAANLTLYSSDNGPANSGREVASQSNKQQQLQEHSEMGMVSATRKLDWVDHTLSIWLRIHFRQRYTHKKEIKIRIFLNIFCLAGP